MHIEQTENELIIKDTPGCLWIFGLFFAFVGAIFVYGSLGGLTDYDKQAVWMPALAFFMGSSAIATGVWIISRAPITKIVVNRINETIVYTKYGLSGKQQSRFRFDEIRQFCLIEEQDDESNPIWSLGMELANKEIIKISALESHDEGFKRNFVFQTNEFMRKQIPSSQMILESEDETDTEIS